jgi:hypothetical protein
MAQKENKFSVVVQGWLWLASVVILALGVKAIATGHSWWHPAESYPWPHQGWYIFLLVVIHLVALVCFIATSICLSMEE